MCQIEILPNKQIKIIRYKPFAERSDKRAEKKSAHNSNHYEDKVDDESD